MTRRFVPWSEFLRERDERIAANQRAAAALIADITRCNCGAPLLGHERYQCQGCRDPEPSIAITTLERERDQRMRDGTGYRPGMIIRYGPEEPKASH